MAGEAVSGRYSVAARHAVSDRAEGRVYEPQRHPASDDRSLVDRLLAGNGDENAFDWGWGDPATGELVTDREPLHDIPELWGPDERAARDDHEDAAAATGPRAPGARLLDDPLGSGPLDGGPGEPERLGADGRDPSAAERERADAGVGGGFYGDRPLDDPRPDDPRPDEPGSDDVGADDLAGDEGPDDEGLDRRDPGDDDIGERGLPDQSIDGDPLDALSTGRVQLVGDPAGGDTPDREPHDLEPHADRSPFDDRGLLGRDAGDRDRPGGDAIDRLHDLGRSYRDLLDSDPRERDLPSQGVDAGPSRREPGDQETPDEQVRADADRFGGPSVEDYPWDRPRGGPLDVDSGDREPLDRDLSDPLVQEPEGQKPATADPRLRRWADRYRPSGSPGDHVRHDRPAASADPLGPGSAFGPGSDGRDRSGSLPPPLDAPTAEDRYSDPASSDSVLTGRIQIGESAADSRGSDRPLLAEDPADGPADGAARDSFDASPEPTTVFAAVDPGPAPRRAMEEPRLPLQEYAARRRTAEQAAASAEDAAASAAERASAAIAAAARAAEEAEAAADAAARAAEEAHNAAKAEVRAIADAVARGDAPGRPGGRVEEPEPPTQAVPLIAPVGAPGGHAPRRRPTGPPPRGPRPDEPSRSDAPHRPASSRGGVDGETTAVLSGLEGLRGRGPFRGTDPAPEVPTGARRRPVAEPSRATDGADDREKDSRDSRADAVDEADAEHEDGSGGKGLVQRFTTRPVLAAVGVGGVLAVAGIVAILTTSEPDPQPAETTPAAVSAPVAVQPAPVEPAVDADSAKAVAFLTALRDDDIPTSSSGQVETEAAAMICAQLDQGADEAQLARSVPAVLPDVTRGQASDVVDYAQQHYC